MTITEPLRGRYDSYEPRATCPAVGSTWVWEPDKAHAREHISVEEVRWNGEEWWIKTSGHWNDLGRFWEACVPNPDPNEVAIGETFCWSGRPSYQKDTPRWRNLTASTKRWSKVGNDLWLRIA